LANLADLMVRQFGGAITLSAFVSTAALGIPIGNVISDRAEKEMFWVTAGPNVTVVTYAKPFGYGAIGQLPRKPMRTDVPIPIGEASIAVLGRPSPEPTSFGDLDSRPERPWGRGRVAESAGTGPTAKPSAHPIRLKLDATRLAGRHSGPPCFGCMECTTRMRARKARASRLI